MRHERTALNARRLPATIGRMILVAAISFAACAAAQDDRAGARTGTGAGGAAPSNSLLAQSMNAAKHEDDSARPGQAPHALRQASQFTVPPPKPREFFRHDLVQIIVREQSDVRSSQSLDTERKWRMDGKVAKWPAFSLPELLEMQLLNSEGVPVELALEAGRKFEGDGEYKRRDDLTARISAEVIEILPNGNLVLEARSRIKTDKEISTMKITGICRPQDISAVNTILSNQLHDLSIDKVHEGELRKSNEKGIIAKVLEALFAF